MRVLILNQYYYPDVAATAQLAADLAEELVQQGHEVTAITSNRSYAGAQRLPFAEEHRGVRIVRVPATAFGRKSKLLRMINYASFFGGALVPALIGRRVDIIIALSTPPFIAAAAALVRRLRSARFVFWVMDVYPDIAIQLGTIGRGSAAACALEKLSKKILSEADAVIALDEAMADRLVTAGASRSRVEVIDNWCDGTEIRPQRRESNRLRLELNLQDTFTISYSGNMGLGHDFATLISAMTLLREDAIHWLFIGDGPRRQQVESAIATCGVDRYSFLPYQAKAELPTSLTAADASIVTVERSVAGLLVPSKVYGVLAAGVPVIYIGPPEGRVAGLVRDHGVGIGVRNGDVVGLVDGIRGLLGDRSRCAEMGRLARELFTARFDRAIALEKHHRLLLRLKARGKVAGG